MNACEMKIEVCQMKCSRCRKEGYKINEEVQRK